MDPQKSQDENLKLPKTPLADNNNLSAMDSASQVYNSFKIFLFNIWLYTISFSHRYIHLSHFHVQESFSPKQKGTRIKKKKRKKDITPQSYKVVSGGTNDSKFTHLQINKNPSPFHTTAPILLWSTVESTWEEQKQPQDKVWKNAMVG